MGKKRIDVIKKIDDPKIRKVTYCKRKKGLLKKSMELALLCDLKLFMFIYDPKQNRVIHFASDPELDLQDLFNYENQREFYSNLDYEEIGGRQLNENEDDEEAEASGDDDSDGATNEKKASTKKKPVKKNRQGRIKRDQRHITSVLGNLNTQKTQIRPKYLQRVQIYPDPKFQEEVQTQKPQSANKTSDISGPDIYHVVKKMSSAIPIMAARNSSQIMDDFQMARQMSSTKIFDTQFIMKKHSGNQIEQNDQANQNNSAQSPEQRVENNKYKRGFNTPAGLPNQSFNKSQSNYPRPQKFFDDNQQNKAKKSANGNDSDSESISAQRSNNTSALHSYDNATSHRKFHQPPKSCIDKKYGLLENSSAIQAEKEKHMKTLNKFMLLYKNYMQERQDNLIKMFFVSFIQNIKSGQQQQNDPQYAVLNRFETVIAKQMQLKEQAEKVAQENNEPVKFMPCIQSLSFILDLIENKMHENSQHRYKPQYSNKESFSKHFGQKDMHARGGVSQVDGNNEFEQGRKRDLKSFEKQYQKTENGDIKPMRRISTNRSQNDIDNFNHQKDLFNKSQNQVFPSNLNSPFLQPGIVNSKEKSENNQIQNSGERDQQILRQNSLTQGMDGINNQKKQSIGFNQGFSGHLGQVQMRDTNTDNMTAYLRQSTVSQGNVQGYENISISDNYTKSKLAIQNKIRMSKNLSPLITPKVVQRNSKVSGGSSSGLQQIQQPYPQQILFRKPSDQSQNYGPILTKQNESQQFQTFTQFQQEQTPKKDLKVTQTTLPSDLKNESNSQISRPNMKRMTTGNIQLPQIQQRQSTNNIQQQLNNPQSIQSSQIQPQLPPYPQLQRPVNQQSGNFINSQERYTESALPGQQPKQYVYYVNQNPNVYNKLQTSGRQQFIPQSQIRPQQVYTQSGLQRLPSLQKIHLPPAQQFNVSGSQNQIFVDQNQTFQTQQPYEIIDQNDPRFIQNIQPHQIQRGQSNPNLMLPQNFQGVKQQVRISDNNIHNILENPINLAQYNHHIASIHTSNDLPLHLQKSAGGESSSNNEVVELLFKDDKIFHKINQNNQQRDQGGNQQRPSGNQKKEEITLKIHNNGSKNQKNIVIKQGSGSNKTLERLRSTGEIPYKLISGGQMNSGQIIASQMQGQQIQGQQPQFINQQDNLIRTHKAMYGQQQVNLNQNPNAQLRDQEVYHVHNQNINQLPSQVQYQQSIPVMKERHQNPNQQWVPQMQVNQQIEGMDNQQYFVNENNELVMNDNYHMNLQNDPNKQRFQQQMGRANQMQMRQKSPNNRGVYRDQQNRVEQKTLSQFQGYGAQSCNDTMSDISKLNLTTVSNINKQVNGQNDVDQGSAYFQKLTLKGKQFQTQANQTVHQTVQNGKDRDYQMQIASGTAKKFDLIENNQVQQRQSEQVNIDDAAKNQMKEDLSQQSKVNCSQSTITRCFNQPKQFYQPGNKYQKNLQERDETQNQNIDQKQEVQERVAETQEQEKQPVDENKGKVENNHDNQSEIIVKKDVRNQIFEDNMAASGTAGGKSKSTRRRNSVQSQIFDPRKVIERIEFTKRDNKECKDGVNQNIQMPQYKPKRSKSVSSNHGQSDYSDPLKSNKFQFNKSIAQDVDNQTNKLSKTSKNSKQFAYKEQVQEFIESKRYAKNMLQVIEKDIDHISCDGVSATNTEINGKDNQITSAIQTLNLYGPNAMQQLQMLQQQAQKQQPEQQELAEQEDQLTNFQILANLQMTSQNLKQQQQKQDEENIFLKKTTPMVNTQTAKKGEKKKDERSESFEQSESMSVSKKSQTVSQHSDFQYKREILRPQNHKNTGNFAQIHFSNSNSLAANSNHDQSVQKYSAKQLAQQNLDFNQFHKPTMKKTGGFQILMQRQESAAAITQNYPAIDKSPDQTVVTAIRRDTLMKLSQPNGAPTAIEPHRQETFVSMHDTHNILQEAKTNNALNTDNTANQANQFMNPTTQMSFAQIPKISGQVPNHATVAQQEMPQPERVQSKKQKNYSFLPQCMQEEFESQDKLQEQQAAANQSKGAETKQISQIQTKQDMDLYAKITSINKVGAGPASALGKSVLDMKGSDDDSSASLSVPSLSKQKNK